MTQKTFLFEALICQVLGYLWQYGVVICVTTNRSPDDLFQGEVSSIWSQALIAYLKQLEIVSLHNESFDYRKCVTKQYHSKPYDHGGGVVVLQNAVK